MKWMHEFLRDKNDLIMFWLGLNMTGQQNEYVGGSWDGNQR